MFRYFDNDNTGEPNLNTKTMTKTKTKITQRHWKKKKTTSYWHLKSPTCHFDIQILHSFPIWYSHFISIHINCQIIITNTWISQTERGSWSTKISPTMIKKNWPKILILKSQNIIFYSLKIFGIFFATSLSWGECLPFSIIQPS